jgi:hypothetical protein
MAYFIKILESELKLNKEETHLELVYFRREGDELVPEEYHIVPTGRFFEELLRLARVCEGYVVVEWEDGERTKFILRNGRLEVHEAVIRYEKVHEIPAEPLGKLLEEGAVKLVDHAALVLVRDYDSICYVTKDRVCIASATSTHVWRQVADILRGTQMPAILCRSPFGTVSEREGPIKKKAAEAAEKVL